MKFGLFLNPAATIEAMAGFVVTTSFLAMITMITLGTGDDWVLGGLNSVISALLCLLIGYRLSLGVGNKSAICAWIAAFVVTAFLSLTQWRDDRWGHLQEAFHIGDVGGICLWLATPIGFLAASRSDRIGRFPLIILSVGFCVQSMSILLDAGGWLTHYLGYDSDVIGVLLAFSEFVCLQLYLIGLTVLMASLCLMKRPSQVELRRDPLAIGTQARKLFEEYDLFTAPRFPRQPIAHFPGVRYLIEFGRTVRWFGYLCLPARRRFGKSINRQLQEIILLLLRDGLDAQAYYMMELYRDGRIDQSGRYLTRYETKNGLFKLLHKTLPVDGPRTKLGDKRVFAELCDRTGIPTIPTFVTFAGGQANWRTDDRTLLDCDLFAKLGRGKGARGAEWFQRMAADRYRALDGSESSLDEILEYLRTRSLEAPIILQPRLVNHPTIADLATDSLLVVRVITCLNSRLEPEVTHGMLRILGKLEPTWPTVSEFGAPVDFASGSLGRLTGDKINDALDWHSKHPITGAHIEGRVLPHWPEIKELAVAAHRACVGRLLIGWDIALTARGPLVVEGNGVPDIAFPQRVHRSPIGASPLGPLLKFHLARLEAAQIPRP